MWQLVFKISIYIQFSLMWQKNNVYILWESEKFLNKTIVFGLITWLFYLIF